MRVHPFAMLVIVAQTPTTQGSGIKQNDQSSAQSKSKELPKVDFGVLSRKEDKVKELALSGSMKGRALSVPCSEGFVDCVGGFGFVNGANSTQTCEAACNVNGTQKCCGGSEACTGFTGKVCKDGSCTSVKSCYEASIPSVVNGCIGERSCLQAGDNGSVGAVLDSCNANDACLRLAQNGGSVGDITSSCNYGSRVCFRLARYGGSVGDITSSCNESFACLFIAYNHGSVGDITSSCIGSSSCNTIGYSGSVGDITSSCNAANACRCAGSDAYYCYAPTNFTLGGRDLYTCCNSPSVCLSADASSLPYDCYPPTLMEKCEEAVEGTCVPATLKKYGRLISCVAKAIKSDPHCDDAIAASNGKGIGHILSDESMFWNRPTGGLRRRQQEATSSCGSVALSLCNNTCPSTDSDVEERSMWFACLDQVIYDNAYNNTEFDVAECKGELTDADAWDFVAVTCGWEANGLFN